jgi:hypothetical protein
MIIHASPFAGRIGVARADITPPAGIFNRNWGAASSDVSTGIHRPLTASALALMETAGGPPLLILSLDLGWWRTLEDEFALRSSVLDALGVDQTRVLLHLTHTHAGPGICAEDSDKPGGAFVPAYLALLCETCARIAHEAVASAQPARLEWGYGACTLARNRDLPDPHAARVLCGWNPDARADDTLLIGRATSESGAILATLVNYACHPVTLAWQNSLISPDFIGGMRDVVEAQTGGAPCLFLQGASGELAPREHYVGDTAVADRNGRILGYAALAALEEMLPPATALEYAGPVESGAPLATWRRVPHVDGARTRSLSAQTIPYELELKPLPPTAEVEAQLATAPDEFMRERLRRKLRVLRVVGDGPRFTAHAWGWRIGEALLVAQPYEAYSRLQIQLRDAVPHTALAVMNITNGGYAYLAPREMYALDQYQVWQSPFTAGCLETCIDALGAWVRRG